MSSHKGLIFAVFFVAMMGLATARPQGWLDSFFDNRPTVCNSLSSCLSGGNVTNIYNTTYINTTGEENKACVGDLCVNSSTQIWIDTATLLNYINNNSLQEEMDPYWTANFSALGASWLATYNVSYDEAWNTIANGSAAGSTSVPDDWVNETGDTMTGELFVLTDNTMSIYAQSNERTAIAGVSYASGESGVTGETQAVSGFGVLGTGHQAGSSGIRGSNDISSGYGGYFDNSAGGTALRVIGKSVLDDVYANIGWGNLTEVPAQITGNYTNDTFNFGGQLVSWWTTLINNSATWVFNELIKTYYTATQMNAFLNTKQDNATVNALLNKKQDNLTITWIENSTVYAFLNTKQANITTNCSAGQFYNGLAGGTLCATPGAGAEVDPTFNANLTGNMIGTRILARELNGTLGYNNLTKCTGTQILKMSSGSWACADDATGAGGSTAGLLPEPTSYDIINLNFIGDAALADLTIAGTEAVAGTMVNTDTDRLGIHSFATAAGINNDAYFSVGNVTGTNLLFYNASKFSVFEVIAKNPTSTTWKMGCGMIRTQYSSEFNIYNQSGIYFNTTSNTGFWQAVTQNNGAVTQTNTTIPTVGTVGLAYHTFRIEANSSAVEFKIDGISRAYHTTNIPQVQAQFVSLPGCWLMNTDANADTMWIDNLYIKKER